MEITEQQILSLLATIADRRAKRAAERAIETLYLEFSRLVRNFVWKTVSQDSMLIEEVIQDTFMEVWKYPERFRGESKFKTWLLSIARHKALDALRKRGKDHELLEEEMEESLAADDVMLDSQIQQEQVHNAIMTCLETLSDSGKLSIEHKEVLHLAYIEDQDISEMAQILNCLESTIKTRLHYARLRIKNCLKSKLFGGEVYG